MADGVRVATVRRGVDPRRFALFAFGGAAGLILGVISGLSRLGENSVDPLMQMLRTLPLFGLIPVFIVWFGIGQLPKILLIAIGAGIPRKKLAGDGRVYW